LSTHIRNRFWLKLFLFPISSIGGSVKRLNLLLNHLKHCTGFEPVKQALRARVEILTSQCKDMATSGIYPLLLKLRR